LVSLARLAAKLGHRSAFLLPGNFRELLGTKGRLLDHLALPILPIDHQGWLRTELSAYDLFAPDVVVDDCSITTGFATKLTGLPRISLLRTGSFPQGVSRSGATRHSLMDVRAIPDARNMDLKLPLSLAELMSGDVHIIPGIPSIEVLPVAIREDPRFIHAGPLLIEDYLFGHAATPEVANTATEEKGFATLRRFLDAQGSRPVVYVTFGLIAKPTSVLHECMEYLLTNGFAVVTSVGDPELTVSHPARYYDAPFLPMHFVCARALFAVHHSGCATYHYPILHALPSITIGTGRCDRDDVGLRLGELGVAVHLPATAADREFVERFRTAVNALSSDGILRQRHVEAERALAAEILQVESEFDMAEVLQAATRVARSRVTQRSAIGTAFEG